MSVTQVYKTVSLSERERFAVECGLENRIDQIKDRIARAHGANAEYNIEQLEAAQSALAKVVAQ